ncbi:MAG TPA: hypothetical protein VGH87_04965 [Polyangiaceae bacterium]|jgi:uncharacterized Zn finger protein (UPF0148 family)
MGVRVLSCVKCGAPLPAEFAKVGVVACPFCSATMLVNDEGATRAAPTPADVDAKLRAETASAEARRAAREAVRVALENAALERRDLVATLRTALATHMQRPDADGVARATSAIISDCARENGATTMTNDAAVFNRVAEAVMKAIEELRTVSSSEMNLPFLASNAAGPFHLTKMMTLSEIAKLSAREPEPFVQPPPVVPEGEPKKKKRWRLF